MAKGQSIIAAVLGPLYFLDLWGTVRRYQRNDESDKHNLQSGPWLALLVSRYSREQTAIEQRALILSKGLTFCSLILFRPLKASNSQTITNLAKTKAAGKY
jgi:hypothetical protein